MKRQNRWLEHTVCVCLALLLAGCASRITTSNSLVTSVCEATQQEMLSSLREVVGGMNNYKFTAKSQTEALVKYDPSNPIMGSATVEVRATQASGMTNTGEKVSGVEFVYTDVTSFMSQDSSFGGGDIISRIKSAFDEYAEFKGISCTTVKRH